MKGKFLLLSSTRFNRGANFPQSVNLVALTRKLQKNEKEFLSLLSSFQSF